MRHVILFDIDGTLINGAGAGRAALLRALAEVAGYHGPTESVPMGGRTDHAIMADLLALAGMPASVENRQRLVDAYLRYLPDCLRDRPGQVLPGIQTLLPELARRQDVAIGLLTGNVQEGARAKLGHFGLWDFFPFGGFGASHVCRDEVARSALAEAQRHLGDQHGPVWVIGDTPFDVRCARAIGARAVGVLTGWHSRQELEGSGPDLLFEDLSDTQRVLQLWA